jgi:acetyl esterase/lipase
MKITAQALCYLAAWDAGSTPSGGMIHEHRLRACHLDYSWDSLKRIDAFLDALRPELGVDYHNFLDTQENYNLLYFLAFYIGEVRARTARMPMRWATWDELLKELPDCQLFGKGFHSSAVQMTPGVFLPLASIVSRLFDEVQTKSVHFSAGIGMEKFPRPPDSQRLPPVSSQTLIPNFPQAFGQLPLMERTLYLEKAWPSWIAQDPLDKLRHDMPLLMQKGRVVWGRVVQANTGLIEGKLEGAPLEVLYDPRGLFPPEALSNIGRMLFQLKGEQAGDPDLQRYADHLQKEVTRLFDWRTPPSLVPYPLHASTSYISRHWLPGGRLVNPLIPLVVSEHCPGSVAIAPSQLWPAEYKEAWMKAIGTPPPASRPVPPHAAANATRTVLPTAAAMAAKEQQKRRSAKRMTFVFYASVALLGIWPLFHGIASVISHLHSHRDLAEARKAFTTQISYNVNSQAMPAPPKSVFRKITYPSPVGSLGAYLSPDPADGAKHPAIIWLTGGDCNSLGNVWDRGTDDDEETASAYREAGIIMMFPSLRGGNDNPGAHEGFYGEVDDVLAAFDYLSKQPYVDPTRIYLGGHSTGGTLALLMAEVRNPFRAVFAFGPASDVRSYRADSFPVDLSKYDTKEAELRSPGTWLASIKGKVYIIEGAEQPSNASSFNDMEKRLGHLSTNGPPHGSLEMILVPMKNHYSVLAPENKQIARSILRDAAANSTFEL